MFMALIVEPPPTTFPTTTCSVRPFKAVRGSVTNPGQKYGTGFQAPGTRTPSSPWSKRPASITRTVTALHQPNYSHQNMYQDEHWRTLGIFSEPIGKDKSRWPTSYDNKIVIGRLDRSCRNIWSMGRNDSALNQWEPERQYKGPEFGHFLVRRIVKRCVIGTAGMDNLLWNRIQG